MGKATYMKVLRRLARAKRGSSGWKRLRTQANALRRRMVAANPPPTPGGERHIARAMRSRRGRKVLSRFRRFWGIKHPPSVIMHPGGPRGVVPLMGMGSTNALRLSSADKGMRGRRFKVHGSWQLAVDAVGKKIYALSGRKPSGKWVPVGYASETWYVPPKDIEDAGSPKAGSEWRHLHGHRDAKWLKNVPKDKLHWPRVKADRGGKIDATSNFIYDPTPTAVVDDWMYG